MVSTYRTTELLSSPVIRELNKSLAVHGITLKMLLGSWSFYIPSFLWRGQFVSKTLLYRI